MKKLLIFPIIIALIGCSGNQDKMPDNTFYCFNNCVRTLPNAPESMETQAALIKKTGFDGLGGHMSENYFQRRAALDLAELKMPELYWNFMITADDKVSYKEGLKEIIVDSNNRDLLVTLFLDAPLYTNNKAAGDKLIAAGIGELADFAAKYNVKIAIYPHTGNYCETTDHAVKIAKLINRKNTGVTFNLCHYLKVEGESGWRETISEAMPYLFMVSINGTDSGNTKEMGWDRLIQPLGEGNFDTYKVVKFLKDNNYNGIIGLQCYNINQDCELALTKSMKTWNEYQKRYQGEGKP